MIIKVLGSGCAKCRMLEDVARQAVAEMGLNADVVHVTDFADIMSYGIMSTPGLVVDEQVRLTGRIPSLDEMKSVLGR